MKYNILIFVLSFFVLTFAKAQEKYVEYNYNSNANFHYTIEFFNDNTYRFLMAYLATSDIVDKITISHGKYRTIKNKIYLTDIDENYTIVLDKRTGYVQSKKIFYPLINKKLIYKELEITENKPSMKKGCGFIYKRKQSSRNLSYGTYINDTDDIYGLSDVEHIMKLIKPNEFVYSYNGIIFFKGTYIIRNEKLLLYDTSLRHTFTFYINNNAIIDGFFRWGTKLTHAGAGL